MQGVIDQESGDNWAMYLGDSCEVLRGIPDNSIDFGIHSLPFQNLFIYSDSEADLGNCSSDEEFFQHYEYIVSQLYRTTLPGRLCGVHCKDLPRYANRDGTAGLDDFPGKIIAAFSRIGWSFHSRITIWKCPVTERERTNNNGLLHKTVLRDRSQLRQGMADYLIMFRKPPVGTLLSDRPIAKFIQRQAVAEDGTQFIEEVPVGFEEYVGDQARDPRYTNEHPSPYARKGNNNKGEYASSINIWRRYAEPVWWDIDQMDVLNYKAGTEEQDERHICPLQIGLIERAVEIWSLPGEIVLSPFAGVGSEGVGAIRRGRKFVGIELKSSYYERACRELADAERAKSVKNQPTLFAGMD